MKGHAARRHGIVSGIHNTAQLPPIDRPARLRQVNPALARSFRHRIPQPPAPGVVGIGPVRRLVYPHTGPTKVGPFSFCDSVCWGKCVGENRNRISRRNADAFSRPGGRPTRATDKRQRICRFRITPRHAFRRVGAVRLIIRAFSGEVDTGAREENASKQKARAGLRFDQNRKAPAFTPRIAVKLNAATYKPLPASAGLVAAGRPADRPAAASTPSRVMFSSGTLQVPGVPFQSPTFKRLRTTLW